MGTTSLRGMDYATYLDQLTAHGDAMRAAAVAAGPAAPSPATPEWTVADLVTHIARVQSWSRACLATDPAAERPRAAKPPADWDDLLPWWDDVRESLQVELHDREGEPAWAFVPGAPQTADFWARRMAHEIAIHRLDAEHATAGTASADSVPGLIYDPPFAADGIDEMLALLFPAVLRPTPPQVDGTLLVHAADAGRAWLVTLVAGQVPEVGPAESGIDADATVAGTADALYRRLWGRPSTALVSGDTALLDALRAP